MSEQPDPAQAALEWWSKQLAFYRQPWPEWRELESRLAREQFEMVEGYAGASSPSRQFLATMPDSEGNRLFKRIPLFACSEDADLCEESEANLLIDGVLPGYVVPVWELKADSQAMMAGGIASALTYDCDYPPTPLTPETLSRIIELYPNALQYLDPESVTLPAQKLWPLQTNSSGTMFWVSEQLRVLGFCPSTDGFEEIGALDNFVRFCLCHVLDGQDWFRAGYNPNRLSQFELTFVERY